MKSVLLFLVTALFTSWAIYENNRLDAIELAQSRLGNRNVHQDRTMVAMLGGIAAVSGIAGIVILGKGKGPEDKT